MNILRYAVAALASVIICACTSDGTTSGGDIITVGDQLPSPLAFILSNGKEVTDESLREKVSVIMLFTVTCTDCQDQLPIFEQVYNDYKDDSGLIIFGISRAQGEEQVSAYLNGEGYTFPYSAQSTDVVYKMFAESIVPRIYVSNSEGIVRFMHRDNPLATYDGLVEEIESLR